MKENRSFGSIADVLVKELCDSALLKTIALIVRIYSAK